MNKNLNTPQTLREALRKRELAEYEIRQEYDARWPERRRELEASGLTEEEAERVFEAEAERYAEEEYERRAEAEEERRLDSEG